VAFAGCRRPTGRPLAGRVELSGDWDSPRTNAEIAADFDRRE
jgi:hypothetical protein